MIFNTKFTEYSEHNGERVEIVNVNHYKSETRYDIRFEDGTIGKNIYESELECEKFELKTES